MRKREEGRLTKRGPTTRSSIGVEDLGTLVEDVERERCEKDLIFLVVEDVEVEDHVCFHFYDMWGDRRI